MARLTIPALIRAARPFVERHPAIEPPLKALHVASTRVHHDLARFLPAVIRPQPRQLAISITSHCNFRCRGCHYGRSFKTGTQLPVDVIESAIGDAVAAGMESVRFYGGEPLLHPDLPQMVSAATAVGMRPYITTNGTLLGKRIDALYQAGLRTATIGYYGSHEHYRSYTQKSDQRAILEESIAAVRRRAGSDFELQLNIVLLKSCTTVEAIADAWQFASAHGMFIHVDLVSYSLPFFNNDPALGLQFEPDDRPLLQEVANALLTLKDATPRSVLHSHEFLRSIPDWLIKRADMRVPCDAYEMIWIGPDGTVQLCDASFELGNLHVKSLSEILYSREHRAACRDAFLLKCPNCMCRADSRIQRNRGTSREYRQ